MKKIAWLETQSYPDGLCLGLAVAIGKRQVRLIVGFLGWTIFIGPRWLKSVKKKESHVTRIGTVNTKERTLPDGCMPRPENLVNVPQYLR